MSFDYFAYIKSLSSSRSIEDLHAVFNNSIQELGINSFCYSRINPENENWYSWDTPYPIMNQSEEWMKRYIEKDYIKKDCIARYCLQYRKAANRKHVFENQDLTRSEMQVHYEASEFGIRFGLTIPVFGPGNTISGLSIYPESQKDTDDLQNEHLVLLHGMTAWLDYWIDNINIDNPEPILSQRQIDCLSWSMEGLSSAEIAKVLAIKEDTVNKHIKSAMNRLNANNRIQAIIRAIRLGILQI